LEQLKEAGMAYKRILVPVDGSATSAKGMKAAVRLAGEMRAKLRLVHVVDEYPAFTMPEAGADIGSLIDALKAAGQKTLSRAARAAATAGVAPEVGLVENVGARVADAIVKDAKRWRADLIVMGTHARKGVKRALLGSDADLVVRYSGVPVLLVPGGESSRR
jgi:nucleotide-binding universal stress UspA family protein